MFDADERQQTSDHQQNRLVTAMWTDSVKPVGNPFRPASDFKVL
jgi:hypothetical protein